MISRSASGPLSQGKILVLDMIFVIELLLCVWGISFVDTYSFSMLCEL